MVPLECTFNCSRKERGASKLKLFRKSAVKLADDLGRKSGYKGGLTGASLPACLCAMLSREAAHLPLYPSIMLDIYFRLAIQACCLFVCNMQDLCTAGGRDRVSGVTQQQMAMYEPGTFDLQVRLSKHAANVRCILKTMPVFMHARIYPCNVPMHSDTLLSIGSVPKDEIIHVSYCSWTAQK